MIVQPGALSRKKGESEGWRDALSSGLVGAVRTLSFIPNEELKSLEVLGLSVGV